MKPGISRALWLSLALLVLAGGWLRFAHPDRTTFWNFDEADYAAALKDGFWTEYLGLKESSGFKFALDIAAKLRAGQETHPWRDAYLQGDGAALRHMHPPLGLYPAAVLAGWGVTDEGMLRMVNLLLGLLACLAAALLAWELAASLSPAARACAAAFAAGIPALSPYHVHLSTNFSYHAAFAVLSLLFLAACTRAVRAASYPAWYLAGFFLAGCILTIEYWVLLGPAWLAAAWLIHLRSPGERLPIFAKRILLGAGALAVFLTVLWPPYLLRGGFLKPIVIYGGLMANPLPASGFSRPWSLEMAVSHPALAAALALGILFGVRRLPKGFWAETAPVLVYAALFVLVNMRVAHMKPLYAGHMVPLLAVLAGVFFFAFLDRRPGAFKAAAACLLLAFPLVSAARAAAAWERVPWHADMEALKERSRGKIVLALSNAPVWNYYLDSAKVLPTAASEAERKDIDTALQRKSIDWVLVQKDVKDWETDLSVDLHGNYGRLEPIPMGPLWLHVFEKSMASPRAGDGPAADSAAEATDAAVDSVVAAPAPALRAP